MGVVAEEVVDGDLADADSLHRSVASSLILKMLMEGLVFPCFESKCRKEYQGE